MRGKQTKPRHKETNTFKFQTFSERISNIKVDVFHRVRHPNEEDSEDETHLQQCLDKWSLLNCTENFAQLQSEIKDVRTLPQVVKKKQHIVSVLLKHLKAKNTLCLQPVLELVVALAKDLGKELHEFYNELQEHIFSLLEVHDADVVEWTFHCLAYLFKFLWRYLVADLHNVFESLLPLLGSDKPYYINNFAAESFAFVARKVKDQRKFLQLALKLLKKFPNGADGCGRLLYEVVSGVQGRLHSCADSFLSVYLQFLTESGVTFGTYSKVMTTAFSLIITNIDPNHSQLLWTSLQKALSQAVSGKTSLSDNSETVKFLLNIIWSAIENRSGGLVRDPDSLVDLLVNIVGSDSRDKGLSTACIDSAADCLSQVLLSNRLMLTQQLASRIVVSALGHLKERSLLRFMEGVLEYQGFDGLILSRLLEYCCTRPVGVTLPLLTKLLILRSPPITLANQFVDWQPYPLNFPTRRKLDTKSFEDELVECLEGKSADVLISQLDEASSCLIVLPHCTKLDKNRFLVTLKHLAEDFCTMLSGDCDDRLDSVSKAMMLLSLVVEDMIKLKQDCPSKLLPPSCFFPAVLKFCQDEGHLSALRALDFYIAQDELNSSVAFAHQIKEKLWSNLMSPYHKVRLVSAHILFELEKGCEEGCSLSLQILESCWLAENTLASVSEYREKLKHIQRLEVDSILIKSAEFVRLPISLLLGQMFINFKLIWGPISKSLGIVAHAYSVDTFWPLFYSQLSKISSTIRRQSPLYKLQQIFSCDYLSSLYRDMNDFDDRPDYINYRIILWTAMKEFPDICEMKNKDVANEILTFIQEEYLIHNAELATTWNIRHLSNESNTIAADSADPENLMDTGEEDSPEKAAESSDPLITDSDLTVDAERTNVEISDEDNRESGDADVDKEGVDVDEGEPETPAYKWANKSLLVQLELMSKFKAPKSVSKESQLHSYYLEFLSHRLSDIQKAALDCLLTYKDKFLVPYRQNLYNLIDDKTFRQEINMFRINSDSDVVKEDHRVDLIPIVLRIVYVKMFSGSVKGKNSRYIKRSAVIRFLGGCTSQELNSYFAMAFPLFIKHVQDDSVKMVESIMSSVDVEKTIPPRRLQSLVTLLRILVVHTGGLLDNDSLGRLLRLVLSHAACAVGALNQRQLVHSTYVKTLRGVRSVSMDIIIWFFDKFQHYPWSANEVDAVFTVFVWPWLEKLQSDSLKAPSPLLKLFSTWTQNPRYFVLLGLWKEKAGSSESGGKAVLSPLGAMMDLWLCKTHKSVYNLIADSVERLLTLVDSDPTAGDIRISRNPFVNKLTIPDKNLSSLNFGSRLMLTHAGSVLEKLRERLSSSESITSKELEMMSRITELVMLSQEEGEKEEDTSLTQGLHSLLLPLLLKKASCPEHVTTSLLVSLTNLSKLIPSPGQHVTALAPLFSKISGPVPRKLLLTLVINSHKRGGWRDDLDYSLIEDLNAYNAKWLDQPDFDRRLEAFKRIESLMKNNGISLDLGLVIIHTCFHFITTEKDLSLRDRSSQCLRELCPWLVHRIQGEREGKLRHLLVDQTILHLIQNGIRNKTNEFLRNESILLLGIMVKECSDAHVILTDLSILSNKEDSEVDFFENMQHLQQHRRLRAMLKFCEAMKSCERAPKARALTQFILPMVSFYLCNERYVGNPTAVDCAIQAVTVISRLLPWHQYLTVLKYYLEKMEKKSDFQKQLVRININILNAFHFDLSAAAEEQVALLQLERNSGVQKNENDSSLLQSQNEEEKDKIDDTEENEGEKLKEDEDEAEEEGVNEEEAEDEEEETKIEKGSLAIDRVLILPRSSSIRVSKTIQLQLIHKLKRSLTQRNPHNSSHKINRRISLEDSDEKDKMRIPLAIAVIKLLQKLPPHFLQYNISGILMKVVSYLKSRVEGVREVARKTLQEIAASLGPHYLSHMVQEMTPLLTKGFHVHVLAFTLHSILVSLKPHFKLGDIDAAIPHIIQVCRMDLFGDCSEEKEVVKIIGKVVEARSTKSFSSFNVMAQYVSEQHLLPLVVPLKQELGETLSAKTVNKVGECLRQIVLGLGENQFIPEESLILFAYGSASESIGDLLPQQDHQVDSRTKEWESRRPIDSYIIPQEPKRQRSAEVKAFAQTNSHLLVEFGLRLLHVLLKRERIKSSSEHNLSLLDPLVKLLSDCIKSQHIRVSTMGIQCLCYIIKYNLPALSVHIQDIVDTLFSILHKFASSGLSKGDNFQLVFAAFKAMGVVVKELKDFKLNSEQTRILLMYCEQDLDDHSRQATAFSLLRSVLAGKVVSPELPDIIQKVATISVTAPLDSVRLQARQVAHLYLMEYPLGKKVDNLLSFYYQNLDYEQQQGRESVLEMLKTIVDSFPLSKLREESGVMFINLTARLVNDPAPECRKTVAAIISSLLSKIGKDSRNSLFDITLLWLQQKSECTRRLAAQVMGLFVSIEKEEFEPRLDSVLPLLVDQFLTNSNRPGKFVLLKTAEDVSADDQVSDEDSQRTRDHLLFQVLQVTGKIITHLPDCLASELYCNHWASITGYCHSLLCHAHEWVRLGSVQVLGLVLSTVKPSELASSLTNESTCLQPSNLFSYEPRSILRSITLDLLAQLTPNNSLNDKFILQILKLLVYIAEVLQEMSQVNQNPSGDQSDEENLSLLWLVKRIRKVINGEIVHAPQSSTVRKMCFKWIGAVAVKLEAKSLSTVGYHLLAPLARELSLCSDGDELREVAREAAHYIRNKLGHDEYTRLISSANNKMDANKALRKTERAQMAVIDPVRAAKRKIHKQQKKKLLKKRKTDFSRTNTLVRKRKREISLENP